MSVFLLGASTSQAEVISWSQRGFYQGGGGNNWQLPQFNPSLGTLNSISIDAVGYVEASFDWTNESADPVVVTLGVSGYFRCDFPEYGQAGHNSFEVLSVPAAPNYGSAHLWYRTNFAAHFEFTSSELYVGTGSVPLYIQTYAWVQIIEPDLGPYQNMGGYSEGTMTLSYNYTVPEPSSMAFLVLGLTMVMLARVERTRKRRE